MNTFKKAQWNISFHYLSGMDYFAERGGTGGKFLAGIGGGGLIPFVGGWAETVVAIPFDDESTTT